MRLVWLGVSLLCFTLLDDSKRQTELISRLAFFSFLFLFLFSQIDHVNRSNGLLFFSLTFSRCFLEELSASLTLLLGSCPFPISFRSSFSTTTTTTHDPRTILLLRVLVLVHPC